MLPAEFGFQIKERVLSLINNESSAVKLFSRLGFLGIFAAIIVVVAPTSADENTPQADPAPAEIIDTTTAIVDTSTPTPYASPISADTSTIGESLTALSQQETTTPLAVQPKFVIKVPNTLSIDPRATTKYIPIINFSGSEYVLACITGNNVNLDIAGKKTVSDVAANGHIIVGDMTSAMYVSGKTLDVLNLINSENGLFAYSAAGGLSDKSLSIELVAMTNPGVKRSFCDSAKSSVTLSFRPIGLELGTVKSGITLK
jgi:hypothetical protein